jgi:hypothetical protein
MNVVTLHSEVGSGQLKHYADAICFSQVGLGASEISTRLDLPEYLVCAWIKNWRDTEAQALAVCQ